MKKLYFYGIPCLMLAVFIFVMNSSFLFKHPGGIDVNAQLGDLQQTVSDNRWDEAGKKTEVLKEIIQKKIYPFVQFSVERDDMIHIDMDFAQINGALEAKDKGLALVYLQELVNDWDNLSK
jgi:hypothetical protein